MILILNLSKNIDFILNIFTTTSSCFTIIASIGASLPKNEDTDQIKGLINSIFLQKEYKTIFFRNPRSFPLETFYTQEQMKLDQELQKGINTFKEENYVTLLDFIINLSFSDTNLDDDSSIKKEFIDTYKVQIVQSMIRIVFSKDKYYYFSNEKVKKSRIQIKQKPSEIYSYYEYYFLERLIYKSVYSSKTGDISQDERIFENDTIFNDILNNIFFLFGNDTLNRSYVVPLKKLLNRCEEKEEGLNIINVSQFIADLLFSLKRTLPYILKIILKLSFSICQEILSISPLDFTPIYSLLFFSFILSPRVQTMFEIKVYNINNLLIVEKIVKYICLKKTFKEDDEYSNFNNMIIQYNQRLKSFIIENIIPLSEKRKDVKDYLQCLSLNKEIQIPKLLFYIDCNNVIKIVSGGKNNNYIYETVNEENNK